MSGVFVVKRVVLVVVLALMLFGLGSFVPADQPGDSGLGIKLVPPPFLNKVQAQTVSTYLDQEAGISAWAQGTPVDMVSVKSICRTIEKETSDYIICSVDVPTYAYADYYDPHVFVHKDGWILAYYFRLNYDGESIPISKMLNPLGKTLNNTLLSITVSAVANAGYSSISEIHYYDFRYPAATDILLIAEEDDINGKTFTLEIPCSYVYYEKSWALADINGGNFSVNGINFYNDRIYGDNSSAYGFLPPISCGVTNEFYINIDYSWAYGIVAILYSVP